MNSNIGLAAAKLVRARRGAMDGRLVLEFAALTPTYTEAGQQCSAASWRPVGWSERSELQRELAGRMPTAGYSLRFKFGAAPPLTPHRRSLEWAPAIDTHALPPDIRPMRSRTPLAPLVAALDGFQGPEHTHHPLTSILYAAVMTALLAGCGGGGGGDAGPTAATASTPVTTVDTTTTTTTNTTTSTNTATIASAVATTEAAAVVQAEVAALQAAAAANAAVMAEAAAATQAEKTSANATAALADSTNSATAPVAAAPVVVAPVVVAPVVVAPAVVAPVVAAPVVAAPVVAVAASPSTPPKLIVRARGSLAAGIGPLMEVRLNGSLLGTAQVNATTFTDYSFTAPLLGTGAKLDIVFTNDAVINGEDRNLFLAYAAQGSQVLMPTESNAVYDRGAGAKAFDGLETLPGQTTLYSSGAMRMTWPAAAAAIDANLARKQDAVRFLSQASFGPTTASVNALVSKTPTAWLAEQMALPTTADYVNFVQAQYDKGAAFRPNGASYTPTWVGQQFWQTAATAPDQLRKRVAFALHQIFMVSQVDSNLWHQARAVARYHDLLNQHAFGNYRALLEDMALSPAMGLYLSHLRNRKEDAATGRMPDENFAREIMQLFSIGLHELNNDGSTKLDSSGNPIETYNNADVMSLAKVFTGWSWAFADNELTDSKFRWSSPDPSTTGANRVDLLPMKAYPGQHSTAAKPLFAGKPWAVNIAAGGSAQADLKQALDALFNHPNVGPFIGRQLIQRLVTSQPSAAYVARVAAVFNNNGSGARGDLGAVVRAILLDSEARNTSPAGFGKLREPVLRVAHWMRALDAKSASGQYMMAWELDTSGQRALHAPSVFNYFRPGYVPPNTGFAAAKATAPEFQIVNESTVAAWINSAEAMAGNGLGWTGSASDVAVDHAALGAMADSGNVGALADHLNLLLLGGRMSAMLRQAILDTTSSVSPGTTAAAYRARAAVFLTLASPEFLTQP